MLNVFTDERYLRARKEKRIEYFENTNAPILTPEYALSFDNESLQDWNGDSLTVTLHKGIDLIPELQSWKDHALFAPIFIELEKAGKTLGRHRDGNEVLYVQVYGSTSWKIEDFYRQEDNYVTLNQGDALYMPKGMFHTVTTEIAPRVGISVIVG
jgi:hypothetical protein